MVALGGGVISTDSLRVITKNFSRARNFRSTSRKMRSAGHKSRFWSSNFHFSRIAPLFSQRNRIRFPLAEFLHGLKRQFSDQNRAKSTPRYSIYYSIYYNICNYYNIYYNIYYTARPRTGPGRDSLRVTMKKFSRARNFRSESRIMRSAGHKSMFWSSNFHFSHNAPLFSPRKKFYGGV